MTVFTYIMLGNLAGGVLSVLAAALVAYFVLGAWVPRMVSYAVGVLLGAAFLDVLPEAVSSGAGAEQILGTTLVGILLFFLLEKTALWRHEHGHEHEHEHEHAQHGDAKHPMGMMIVVGDGFHNFVDGILLAAAFMQDVKLGIATALAIIAHEIPQEVGDFMVLLHSGYSKKRALVLNLASSLASVVGGVLGYFVLNHVEGAIPYVLALAAASFIYIAVADLVPTLHRHNGAKATLSQSALILLGIATVPFGHWLAA
jgi:zinc and cadmium transporter